MAKKLPEGFRRRETKDGTVYLEYRFVVNDRRCSVYGKNVRDCREKEYQKRQQVEAGVNVKADCKTLNEYFDQWMRDRRGTVGEETARCNQIMFNSMKDVKIDGNGDTIGNMKLKDIETKDIRAVQNALKDAGRKTRGINDSISLLSGILGCAVMERIITWNPAKPVKALKRTEAKAAETIHRALTKQETEEFLRNAEDSWYKNLYIVLLHTGMRIGEAGAMTSSDISDKGIHVHRTVTRTETGSYKIGDAPKTAAGNRFIPLDDEAQTAIRDQKAINDSLKDVKITDIERYRQPIFTSPRGAYLKSANVNSDIARICKKAGIDYFSVHAFRDTFATRCVESGMDVKQLQSIMGHTNIAMTLGLYAHANDDLKAEQLKAVNFM